MKNIIVVFALFTALTSTANAQTATPRADTRQGTQRARIHDGRNDGDLTKGEAAALNSEQRSIRRVERRAKADGQVTAKEKMRIEKKQDRSSRHICKAKNNKIATN